MYKVNLKACGNIDHFENPYDNKVNGVEVPQEMAEASSIEECQSIVKKYIEENNLGSGNWDGGEVYKDGTYIGRISYNTRFWDSTTEYGHN